MVEEDITVVQTEIMELVKKTLEVVASEIMKQEKMEKWSYDTLELMFLILSPEELLQTLVETASTYLLATVNCHHFYHLTQSQL